MLSGKSGLADIRAGLRVGVEDYHPKPFDPDELLRSISLRISRREQKCRLDALLSQSLNHDSRTLLTCMLGFAESLRAAAASGNPIAFAEVAEAASAIEHSAERLLKLIERVGAIMEIASSSTKPAATYGTIAATDWLGGTGRNRKAVAQKIDRAPALILDLDAVPVPLAHGQLILTQLVETAFEASPRGFPVKVNGSLEGQACLVSVDSTNCAPPQADAAGIRPEASPLRLSGARDGHRAPRVGPLLL